MKATVLTEVKKPLTVVTSPDLIAAPGHAVVQLKAAALNHRDLWTQLGLYPNIKLPVTLGSDGAGIVTSVGTPADRAWVGREVIINPALDWGLDPRAQGPGFRILGLPDNGTFAEQLAIPAANLAPKPAHLAWEQAAALPLAGLTAWRALFTRAQLKAGERVLVTGVGGGAALFALQFAVAAGAEVWVTSGSPEKISRAQALGARGGGNYRDAGWAEALQKQAGRFDVIVDSAGGDGFARLIDLTTPGGRLVFFGATTGTPPGPRPAQKFLPPDQHSRLDHGLAGGLRRHDPVCDDAQNHANRGPGVFLGSGRRRPAAHGSRRAVREDCAAVLTTG